MTVKSMTQAALTWSRVTARRMARHALTEPATDLGSAGIGGVLCGARAQVLSAAELSLGRRIAGRPVLTSSARCGRSALWSRRLVRAAPCTC